MVFIYILLCLGDKYYIGYTNTPNFSIENHDFNEWTRTYKPVEIIEIFDNCDRYDEDKYTIKYMDKYGIDNVRGGSWKDFNLSLHDRNTLNKIIQDKKEFRNNNQYSYSYNNPSYNFPNNHQTNNNTQTGNQNPVEDMAQELGLAFGTIFNQIEKVSNSFISGFQKSVFNNH